MTCKSGRVEFQNVSPERRWSSEERVEGKGRFSVVCGIERKTVRGESSWFEYIGDVEERARRCFWQCIPESRSCVVEGSVSNFEPRWIGRTLEGDNCG